MRRRPYQNEGIACQSHRYLARAAHLRATRYSRATVGRRADDDGQRDEHYRRRRADGVALTCRFISPQNTSQAASRPPYAYASFSRRSITRLPWRGVRIVSGSPAKRVRPRIIGGARIFTRSKSSALSKSARFIDVALSIHRHRVTPCHRFCRRWLLLLWRRCRGARLNDCSGWH